MSTSSDSVISDSTLSRLHISPLHPALFPVYLTADQQLLASHVTYHTILTFPDRPYGYVTLPKMEADKLKKKLNGSILKGSKIRIEEAKPQKKRKADEEAPTEEKADKKKPKKSKRRDKVIEGVELPEERKVKRGWTAPDLQTSKRSKQDKKEKKKDKEARKIEKSKYSKEPELLFKTILPANVHVKDDNSKKKDKRKSRGDREVVVHEFEKNQKQSTFLKTSKSDGTKKPAVEFIEGKGWIDEDGNTVEEVKTKRRREEVVTLAAKPKPAKPVQKKTPNQTVEDQAKINDILRKSKATDSATNKTEKTAMDVEQNASTPRDTSSESSSESESESESDSDEASSKHQTPSPPPDDAPQTPHPLETIFKRPANRPGPIQIPFNFFGNNADTVEEEEAEVMDESEEYTRTPFTRHNRSGAPTPDTSAVNRRFSFSRGVIPIDDDDDDDDEPESATKGAGRGVLTHILEDEDEIEDHNDLAEYDVEGDDSKEKKDESPFAKWFWEHRGENNRTWRRMRRDAMKEKRKRENRRIGRRIV